MTILARLALLFVLVPLAELFLLLQVGEWIGLWWTLGLVVATGVAGAALARIEGLRTLWAFRGELARGKLPSQSIQDGLAVLVGGALLLTPGLLTDVFGFSLLLPPTRRWIQARVRRAIERRIRDGSVQVRVMGVPPFDRPPNDGPFQDQGSGLY